ncbi:MAG: hypothetical protein K6G91_00675 [Kiritimatiellae bacterium]|nr:hypothetical protein [Kiritimatiellia bacterium]
MPKTTKLPKLNGNVTDLAENPVFGPVRKTFGVTAASPLSGYGLWSASHGIGTWNAKDALGIHNVFRYTFDKPAGAFETPALIDIAIEGGSVVVKTPPVVNAEGFAVSVVESSDAASRFYRLSARQDLQ